MTIELQSKIECWNNASLEKEYNLTIAKDYIRMALVDDTFEDVDGSLATPTFERSALVELDTDGLRIHLYTMENENPITILLRNNDLIEVSHSKDHEVHISTF